MRNVEGVSVKMCSQMSLGAGGEELVHLNATLPRNFPSQGVETQRLFPALAGK